MAKVRLNLEASERGIDRIVIVHGRDERGQGIELLGRVLPALGDLNRLLRGPTPESAR
jgi:hypothetical protein